MKSEPLAFCSNAEVCSGCSEWAVPYAKQLESKKNHLQNLFSELSISLPEIQIYSKGSHGFRDRFDFTIEEGRVGLYSQQIQFIVDLPTCLQLSPMLNQFYQEFRKIKWPIKKGSVRLRISPEGQKGAWLDFSNLDVKKLIDEETSLLQLLEIAHVEIGQRKKVLVKKDRLRLEEPVLQNWSRTWQNGNPIPLYGTVATFSQAGDELNQLIIQEFQQILSEAHHPANILEYGSGNGNLTFSALSPENKITLLETDELALQGLQRTAEEKGLFTQIQVLNETQLNSKKLKNIDCIIANPPRAGLQKFLATLHSLLQPSPMHFLYMSCYPESFLQDAKKLTEMNYELKQLKIIDQFPQTKHYEIISRWQQKI